MSRLKSTIFRFAAILFYFLALPVKILAQNAAPPAMIGNLNPVFGSLTRALVALVGISSLVMLIVGGFYFITAGADKDASQRAQHTINYSIGGLIISLSAWLLLSLMGNFLGVDLNVFNICISANASGPCN